MDGATAAKNATVDRKGSDWGDTPLWAVESKELQASVDVYALDEAQARELAAIEFDRLLNPPVETLALATLDLVAVAVDALDPKTATVADIVTALKSALAE